MYDRRLHPEQCVVLYQISVQWLRNQVDEDVPAQPQPKSAPSYSCCRQFNSANRRQQSNTANSCYANYAGSGSGLPFEDTI